MNSVFLVIGCMAALCLARHASAAAPAVKPFYRAELIFPLEVWHNHASCIVETPQGDLLACWFNEAWVMEGDPKPTRPE